MISKTILEEDGVTIEEDSYGHLDAVVPDKQNGRVTFVAFNHKGQYNLHDISKGGPPETFQSKEIVIGEMVRRSQTI